jgi:NTE family protein
MPKMGLVLQGGGALGAYEYGAVTRLVERGWEPVAVTGVSIGAATAAAIAGARDGDICASLRHLWEAITLSPVPLWPADRQAMFSIFGNPKSGLLAWPSRFIQLSKMDEPLGCGADAKNIGQGLRF